MTTTNDWRNLIAASEQVNPLSLTPHPRNFYTHPMQQRKVVNAAIDDIGYVDEIVVNRRTNRIVNGHLRVELAIGNGEEAIPVTWIDCDEEIETRILLFFDRVGELAKVEGERVRTLVSQVEIEAAPLQDMLDEWVATFEKFSRPKPAPAPAPVAAAAAPAPVATPAAAAPVASPQAATAALATPVPPVAAAAEPVATPDMAGPTAAASNEAPAAQGKDAGEEQAIEAEGTATGVARHDAEGAASVAGVDVTATLATAEALQEAQTGPVAADEEPAPSAQDPEPADNYEAAILEDGGEAVTAPEPVAKPARAAKPAKPPVVVIKVGEYDQELPEALFVPWWNELVATNGGDWYAIVADVRARLQLPDDPR